MCIVYTRPKTKIITLKKLKTGEPIHDLCDTLI